MKTLSLLQPWASLVVMGAKTIETRSWTTAYRGPLLIHASKSGAGSALAAEPPFTRYIPAFGQLPFGAVIGRVYLTDVVRTEALGMTEALMDRLTLEEKVFGDYRFGRWGWILEDPVLLETPLPAKGSLGLWEYPDEDIIFR